MKSIKSILITVAALVAMPVAAHAQVFPADGAYDPFYCTPVDPMSDLYQDESGAINERDIVGDADEPAGLRASDDNFLYLRLRLDADPAPGGTLSPFAWGMELDADGDLTTYEVLVLVNGINAAPGVYVYRNTSTTVANDPTDPANEPPIGMFATATHVQSAAAASNFGGNADRFLDFAVPWSVLEGEGIDGGTEIAVWAASSSSENSLNGDFACHDGRTGEPTLSGTVSDDTVLDPDLDSDGDGFTDEEEIDAGTDPFDPNDFPDGNPGVGQLEGGGGCAAGGGGGLGLVLVLVALVLSRRGRCRSSRRLSSDVRALHRSR